MRSLLLGAFLAALVLFVWGFVVWALMPVDPFTRIADEAAVSAALLEQLPATGYYLLPGDDSDMDAYVARHREGPLALITFRREGADPLAASGFVLGFLHMLVSMLLLGLVLRAAVPRLHTYGARVTFVAFVGLLVGVWAHLGEPIWWHQPWSLPLLTAAHDVIGFALAGLVLARFVRPEPAMAEMLA
ncbi:MAG TPA: hypothetical protein VK002_03335 [Rubricoccaceae bacterium]|nr:hypothetical protein [Rubricoccaceae bacterium]